MRRLIKRVARTTMMALSTASGLTEARARLSPGPRVRVLTYHRFADEPENPFSVSLDAFEAQLRDLAEARCAISLAQLQRFLSGEGTVPEGACLVTIDDGFASTYTEALPALRRWGIPAVAFISAGLVGTQVRYPERYLGWGELRALVASELVTIGSHAYTHRSLGLLAADVVRDEVERSKAILEDRLGVPVEAFAYPFGTRTDFTARTDGALREAGYRVAFHSMHGAIASGMEPISLPRVKVEGGEGRWMFRALRRGGMDGWRLVDETLFHLQRVRHDTFADPTLPEVARDETPAAPVRAVA